MNNSRSWVKRAGEIARSYLSNVEELAGRKKYTRFRRRNYTARQNNEIYKPVEAAALRVASDRRIAQLEREVEAVEWAFDELKKVENGEEVARVAEKLYITRYKISPERAAYELNMDKRTVYRYNRAFLKLVGAYLGLWAPLE